MGVKLGDLVKKRSIAEGELKGWTIGLDAYNIFYQFVSSIRTREGHLLTNEEGRVVSHLKGILTRTSNMIEEGIRPVYIFDGKPHELKKGTLDLRKERKEKARKEWEDALEKGDMEVAKKKAQQTSRLTDEMIDDSKRLLDLMGIPYIISPGEGEAQASYMCRKKNIDAVSSQDFDTLLFGCPLLIRNLAISGKRKLPGRKIWINVEREIIDLEETLTSLSLTREQLVDMAILMGTDFNEGVKGIGPKKALKLISEYGDLENAAKADRIPLLEWSEVRNIFLDPDITDDYEISWSAPREEELIDYLVEEMDFGRSGVMRSIRLMKVEDDCPSQSSLDSFF
ncbi:MAG: flap endonuclease-1 [Thermoplasmatota archaeon]